MGYLKSELSKKNKYYLPKHRYYELKHFCLQYPEWKRAYLSLSSDPRSCQVVNTDNAYISDKTSRLAVMKTDLLSAIKLVENTAYSSDYQLGDYILKSVTEGVPFTALKAIYEIPCERDMFYDRYRRFYWLLSNEKGL